MKTVFVIDGGAGRVVTSIPSLLKYARNNPKDDFKICIPVWDNLLWGIAELQEKTFNLENKGIFENVFFEATRVVSPEPYKLPAYYRQEKHLSQAFDTIINQTEDHSDLPDLKLVISKGEEIAAVMRYFDESQKDPSRQNKKNIVIQPWGSSARKFGPYVIDESSRSLTSDCYLKIVSALSEKYNLYYFGEKTMLPESDSYSIKVDGDLRFWMAMIDSADYFIGCDSVGQHFARAFRKPGTVILGSTFAKNVSYPDHFNIFEKPGKKKYSPLRINLIDCSLADKINDTRMDFSDEEINSLLSSIESRINMPVPKPNLGEKK